MPLPLEHLIEKYIKIRDHRSALKKQFDAKDGELKALQEKIEARFLQTMNETGTDQLKVKGVGMVLRSERVLANAKDWEAIWQHVMESGNVDLLQRRLSSKAVQEFMESHEGDAPPGIQVVVERGVTVRRTS